VKVSCDTAECDLSYEVGVGTKWTLRTDDKALVGRKVSLPQRLLDVLVEATPQMYVDMKKAEKEGKSVEFFKKSFSTLEDLSKVENNDGVKLGNTVDLTAIRYGDYVEFDKSPGNRVRWHACISGRKSERRDYGRSVVDKAIVSLADNLKHNCSLVKLTVGHKRSMDVEGDWLSNEAILSLVEMFKTNKSLEQLYLGGKHMCSQM
jgi:hypothetical protein